MSNNIYYYHKLINDTYKISDDNSLSFPLKEIVLLKSSLWEEDKFNFEYFNLPSKIKNLFDDLIIEYKLLDLSEDLIKIVAITQNLYISNSQNIEKIDTLSDNFINLEKDLSKLFDSIEKYLFSKSKTYLKSIRFNTNKDGFTIDNFFIVSDIYEAIIDYYNFTEENFHTRKQEILNSHNTFQLKNNGKSTKTNIVRVLHDFLSERDFNQSDSLRFIGTFLHLAQIQSNDDAFDIEIYDDIETNLKGIDIKDLRHYLKSR